MLSVAAAVTLTACSTAGSADDESASDQRGAQAIAEVTSLEGTEATPEEHAFVDELADMSRPHWDSGPEAMVLGYNICVSGTPSAAVFDLVDEGWSRQDAEVFVDAAVDHLC